LFTSPPHDGRAQLRSVAVLADGSAGRAGSVTGMSAVMAVLDAMGLLADAETGEPFVLEGLSGALLRGRVVQRTMVGEVAALVPEIAGSAWVTGEHRFLADPTDPFSPRT